jgi:hypothetical protein
MNGLTGRRVGVQAADIVETVSAMPVRRHTVG